MSATSGAAWVDGLVRPAIRRLVPYASARGTRPGAAAAKPRIQLDANEWGGEGGATGFERYPDPQPAALRAAYARHVGVREEALFLGRGADEAIDVLLRTFCDAGRDAILVTPPSYGYYAVAAAIQGAGIVTAPLAGERFDLDEDAIVAGAREGVKLVFVCSPNNPTGNAFAPERLSLLARRLEGRALLVVDEAYGELSSAPSLAPEAARRENLVVLRTLSKALGHAGVRVGAAVACPATIGWMQKVRAPYPLSLAQVDVALRALALAGGSAMEERRGFVAEERLRVSEALRGLRCVERIWPSEANFLLVRLCEPLRVMAGLDARGILVRDRGSELGLERCVRISIGNRNENDALITAMRALEGHA